MEEFPDGKPEINLCVYLQRVMGGFIVEDDGWLSGADGPCREVFSDACRAAVLGLARTRERVSGLGACDQSLRVSGQGH